LVFEEPVRVGGEGAAHGEAAVLAPFEVGGLLFVADESVVPGGGDGNGEVIGAGAKGMGDLYWKGRMTEDAKVLAVEGDTGQGFDFAEVEEEAGVFGGFRRGECGLIGGGAGEVADGVLRVFVQGGRAGSFRWREFDQRGF
jgi:hypothetical protein